MEDERATSGVVRVVEGAEMVTPAEDMLMQIIAAENLAYDANINDETIARLLQAQEGRVTLRVQRRKLPKQTSLPVSTLLQSGSGSNSTKDKEKENETEEHRPALEQRPNAASSQKGHLYVWGVTLDGQLGLGNKKDDVLKPTHLTRLDEQRIRQVACGKTFTLALAANGDIFSWGSSLTGQLGHNDQRSRNIPFLIRELVGINIRQVACGDGHVLCLTDMGKVVGWGSNSCGQLGTGKVSSTPQLTPTVLDLPFSFAYVACGASHSAIISDGGECYMFGRGENGQLGNGKDRDRHRPCLVSAVKHEICFRVACGVAHTTIVTIDGKVYTFGRGNHGRLGHGTLQNSMAPKQVMGLKGKNIVAVGCGWQHTVALDDNGRIYTWGAGKEGQLGLGDKKDCKEPRELLSDDVFVQVECGYRHTAAISDNGSLYVWGEGRGGKLGIGTTTNTFVPSLVGELHNKSVRQVGLGGNHSAAIVGSEPSSLVVDLGKLLNSKELSDITFKVEGRAIYAHKAILSCRNRVFARLFASSHSFPSSSSSASDSGSMMDVELNNTRHAVFFAFLEYLYTDFTCIYATIYEDLYDLAFIYQSHHLISLCKDWMRANGIVTAVREKEDEEEDSKTKEQHQEEAQSTYLQDIESLFKNNNFSDIRFEMNVELGTRRDEPQLQLPTPSFAVSSGEKEEEEQEKQTGEEPLLVSEVREKTILLPAHKCILFARSPYFRTMFTSGMKESLKDTVIALNDVSYAAFLQVLRWIYGLEPKITPVNVVEVLMLSNQYRVHSLKQLCQEYLEENLSVEIVASIAEMAYGCSLQRLTSRALDFLVEHLEEVQAKDAEGWEALPEELKKQVHLRKCETQLSKHVVSHNSHASTDIHVLEQDLYDGNNVVMYKDLTIPKTLANKIVQARTNASLTRKELAALLGIKPTLLTEYETGKALLPSRAFIQKMEAVLKSHGARQTNLLSEMPKKHH
ncbi:rho-related protein racA [Balamuthia mandrillaris]